ncbi:hypothetical protein CALVIDRAFT_539031 [Calocera viscosa TUFC12733]|uniref:CENP-V/GFA domain-containing protein n=1 Tax=Calocera viscosa (strain TUFC12733) TaxID=1330018 RepID=A0A167KF66_CALVF|nr:hypothetical protein CALVIDRAFT_539031 [Calocera viscosa TUFC12733]
MSTNLTLRCHCNLHNWSIPYPSTALPTPAWYCHCSICRRVSGAPFIAHLGPLPVPLCSSTSSPPDSLRVYNTSARGRRYSCTKCGTYLATSTPVGIQPELWFACVGTLELGSLSADQAYKFGEHYDVLSTGDGGFAGWLDDDLPKWVSGPPAEFVFPAESLPAGRTSDAEGREVLRGGCHCGGVRLEVLRPPASTELGGTNEIREGGGERWSSKICWCSDCRRSLGYPCPAFLTVGREHFRFLERRNLQVYKSSPKVERTFCGTCGASVSRSSSSGDVDLCIGLLDVDSENGDGLAGLLNNWVQWESFQHDEDCRDKVLRDALLRGMRKDRLLDEESIH